MEVATFAGGCFWCTEAVFKRIKGVVSVTSGYSGGDVENPSYEKVSRGTTGHAEAIQIEFNPKIISFERLLEIFWATHDPTTLNRQGTDVGTQYRSAVFYHNGKQHKEALASKEAMEKSKQVENKIVTTIEPFKNFFKAEDYHQSYYEIYRDSNPYCSVVINPKIEKLISKFNSYLKDEYKE